MAAGHRADESADSAGLGNTAADGSGGPADGGSPGHGWWQASDDQWYPPEQHPNYVPALPSPPVVPAHPSSPPPDGQLRPSSKVAWVAVSLSFVCIGAVLLYAVVYPDTVTVGDRGGFHLQLHEYRWSALFVLLAIPVLIVAMVCAARVPVRWGQGNYASARTAAKNAKGWAAAGLVVAVAASVVFALSGSDTAAPGGGPGPSSDNPSSPSAGKSPSYQQGFEFGRGSVVRSSMIAGHADYEACDGVWKAASLASLEKLNYSEFMDGCLDAIKQNPPDTSGPNSRHPSG